MADKKSFVFYHEWGEILKKLPVEEVGNITLALIDYSERGVNPTLSPVADIAFTAFKQAIDRDSKRWKETCQVRSENGKKGGRPKKANGFFDNQNKPNAFLGFSEKAKKADNVNDNVNVNVIEYENDNESENENEKHTFDSSSPLSKPKFKKFGEYQHIKLTDEQHSKLISEFGEAVISEYIKRCDEYVQQTGKKYKDFYLTIRNWINKDGGAKAAKAAADKSKYTDPYDVPLFSD